ncbi:exocyst complex subunit 7 [Heterostelium album PN500]|uniref:Exocyst subunit Exo70 family protein n=1 Tax=Heterostelium pallidum (strain ATCC 26659 / Pp 5 / PN500) TaxID=670386 RepID=D3BCD4_HETP5|nr:exocyst complex subunit 7 [Heterostelium album PN500]EFA80924.1 exocyst complex subunit 7 [Heterostelium album PN500]|eukprot:XP_020433042.1 exocyst complex subunit 7 [Heterostelium album PN500]
MSAPPRLSARASLLDKKPTTTAGSSTTSGGGGGGSGSGSSTPMINIKSSGGITKPPSPIASPPLSHRTTPSLSSMSSISRTSNSSLIGNLSSHSRGSSGSGLNSLLNNNISNQQQQQSKLSVNNPLNRVQQHSRKASRSSGSGGSFGGGAGGPRWGSNVLSYQDYVDEELFYSTPTEEDDEEFEQIRNLLNSEYSITTHQTGGPLKGGQLVVLSWKNDAADKSTSDEQLENDSRDLQFLKESLGKTNSLANQMVFILDRFNDGLSSLEHDVAPINASMKEWSTIYNNINLTMDSIRSVLERFDLSKIEQKIREGAKGDYVSYMATLDNVVQSIDFLQANHNYKAADKALATLKELKSTGLSELESNFKSLLLKISNIIDPTTIGQLPSSKRYLAIISPTAIEEIAKSIELFQRLHHMSFLKEYKDKRNKFLLLSLSKMSPEKFAKSTSESKNNLAYVKGTHPLIAYVHETLRLYQIESDLARELFGDQYHTILEEIIHPSHELLLDTTEPIIKAKKTSDKVFGIFPLLDLFDTFTKLQPEFAAALSERDGKHISDIKEIIKILETTCSSLLEFNIDDEFRKEEKYDQSTTVDQTTSNRLIEYRGSVEFLLSRSKSSSFNDFLDKTLRGLFKYLQARSKKDFLVISSAIELNNKVPFRGNIFLINNYHKLKFEVPDHELRDKLSSDAKEIITKIYEKFKELCRQDKIHLEKNFTPFESNDDINRKIDKVFESQY